MVVHYVTKNVLLDVLFFLFVGSIGPGESVTLQLKSKEDSPKFRGFFIQAKDISGNNTGSFKIPRTTQAKCISCNEDLTTCDSISHRNSGEKSQITVTWRAPSDFTGSIYFRYTVVLNYYDYWVAVDGPTLTVE